MKKFSIRTLLVVIAMAAFVAWQFRSDYRKVFSESTPEHGRLEIFGREDSGHYKVRIRFMPAGGGPEDFHESPDLLFRNPVKKRLSFRSVVDQATGRWFVCDENDQGLVVVVLERPKDVPVEFRQFWHPGVHVGWLRGMWAEFYREAKGRYPELPYEELPGEMKVEAVD